MKTIITFFSFVLYKVSVSQVQFIQYYADINLAQHYFIYEQYHKADSCFKMAFSLDSVRGFNQDYLLAAANELKLRDTALAKTYLYACAIRGGKYKTFKNSNTFGADGVFNFIMFKQNKALRKKLNRTFKQYKKSLNKKVCRKIHRLYVRDQTSRVGPVNILPSKMQDNIIERRDRKNIKALLLICKQYGWPGYNLIGERKPNGKYSIRDADLMIRHYEMDKLKELEPFIMKEIKKVNEYPYVWASAMDYCFIKTPLYMDSVKFEFKQKYGTLYSFGSMFSRDTTIANKNMIIPFGKMEELIKARNELFLEPIDDFCKIRKAALPKEEIGTMYRKHKKR
jgi:hypothetical protein